MERPFDAYRGSEPYLFVSYSHADAALIYPELELLHQSGFNIWYDEGIAPGIRWRDELAERLADCSLFLFYISPRSIRSDNCMKEVNFALSKERPLLNVYLQPTDLPPGLEYSLSDRQSLAKAAYAREDYERKLSESISHLMPQGISTIGDYRVREILWHAGQITRVAAEQLSLARSVQLILTSAESQHSAQRTRLLDEARLCANIESPHFQSIHGIGEWRTQTYVATEVGGRRTLEEELSASKSGLSVFHALRIADELAHIIEVLAEHNVSLDLFSPKNLIFRDNGQIYLAFPGLNTSATGRASSDDDTRYASPEQLAGAPLDPFCSYYSIGLLLFEMLTGKLPYDGGVPAPIRHRDIISNVRELRTSVAFEQSGTHLDRFSNQDYARHTLFDLLETLLDENPLRRRQRGHTATSNQETKSPISDLRRRWNLLSDTQLLMDDTDLIDSLRQETAFASLDDHIARGDELSDMDRYLYRDYFRKRMLKLTGHLNIESAPDYVVASSRAALSAWLTKPLNREMWGVIRDEYDATIIDHRSCRRDAGRRPRETLIE
jgi:serine/threonine protein kinase